LRNGWRMRSSLVLVMLFARLARAEPEVELRVRSTGREVTIDLFADGSKRSCVTPCVLRVSPGSHRARVDGLDRTLVAGDRDTEVVITPTRSERMIAGITLAALGAFGLTFAGHWASPLDDRQRVTSALAGAAMMGFAIPFIVSSGARVGARAHPSRADVFAGVHVRDGDRAQPLLALGVGFRPREHGFGAQLRGRFSSDVDRYQFAIGPTLHGPQLVGIRPAIAVHVGVSSQRGPETPADLAAELPAMPGAIELRALFDVEARLELAVFGMFTPSIGATIQTLPDRTYALDVGVHVPF